MNEAEIYRKARWHKRQAKLIDKDIREHGWEMQIGQDDMLDMKARGHEEEAARLLALLGF